MKPQDQQGGGSRAAKKRAKKKKKNKQPQPSNEEDRKELVETTKSKSESKKRPLEEKDVAGHSAKNKSSKKDNAEKKKANGGGGILKKPKYSSEGASTKNSNTAEEDQLEDTEENNMQEEELQNLDAQDLDVLLPQEIQELITSDKFSLQDLLLLPSDKKKKQSTTSKSAQKSNKDVEKMVDEDNSVQNPFQELTSKQRARCALNILLAPSNICAEEFYEEYWEKKALCVQVQKDKNKKHHKHRFDGFLSLKSIRQWTERHTLHYGRDLNVTRYHTLTPGQPKRRANIDPPPYQDNKTGETKYVQADSSFVWEQYDEKKATVRLLCPHKHNDTIHSLLSLFELEWGCMVGANAYLTPPGGSQGFAPHYDDIEAFCLQLEGRKRWKVYAPPKEARLPRVSSEDFTDEDMMEQEPVLDVVLEPGDFLYMPRGWVHQGITLPGNEHSLHLTMSAMQQWAWVDYLELLMPEALEAAANSETSISLRKGLPRNFLDYMGAMYDQRDDDLLPDKLKEGGKNKEGEKEGNDNDNDEGDGDGAKEDYEEAQRQRLALMQENFREEAKKRIMRVAKEAMDMVDAACDQIGKRFLSDRLPPGLTAEELAGTTEGQKDAKIWPTTLCRLSRPGIARLVLEDGKAVLYHCADNSRVFHERALEPMEFEVDDAPALEQLITTVEPEWIPVSDLIHEGMGDKIAIAQALYDEGILAIVNPEGGLA
ncbi:demethylase and histidyl-hydroxylase NO66 [Seminavis robusta]|uniref:Bifunctional lysine-specific demethylase and histidyl-hydroxylase n=1 Tax=Seminavis robusta TaxID=568900 RepID=A0A9N8DX85_9STRA|nr:demethylase and histidyl-hydroxylase NO66 [Seminavis robusta]|eukprot:Sro341_g121550.1 demethylase and histidyl-hydroxylase NO66 (711) ;mRNA; r:55758-58150